MGDILKPLLPSLKEKKRYIAFEVLSDNEINQEEAYKAIENNSKDYLGSLGLSKASFLPLNIWKNNRGIIKVAHKEADNMKASLTLIKNINQKNVVIRSIGVSGVLNKAKFYLGG